MRAQKISRRRFLAASAAGIAAASSMPRGFASDPQKLSLSDELSSLEETHDLPSLSPWGPYSKKLYGISHIPKIESGLLFDLSIFPAVEGTPPRLPNVTDRCGVHPWHASSDLSYYSTRTELLWKDQIYCDQACIDAGPDCRLICIELVNNTAAARRVTLHALSQMCFPPLHELTAEPIRLCDVSLPPSAVWVDALDYLDMRFATPRPTDTLVPEGRWRGEERMHNTVGGSALAQGFGRDAGDTALYKVTVPRPLAEASVVFRFRLEKDQTTTLRCSGLLQKDVLLRGTDEFATSAVDIGPLSPGQHTLRLTSIGSAPIALNGFAVVEHNEAAGIAFPARPWHPKPTIAAGPRNSVLLKYDDLDAWYGFTLGSPAASPHLVPWRDLDVTFGAHSGQNTYDRIFGRGKGRPGDPESLFVRTSWPVIELHPSSRQTFFGLIATGTEHHVRSALQEFDTTSSTHLERWKTAGANSVTLSANPEGQTYLRGQQLLAATTLTNVVYPLRTQRQTIRHYSPGKIWDCLYTWDAGFIGLGLLELDIGAAIESLNQYLTPPASQSSFIHHGTPLPTQIYLFAEIWNRTQSAAFLRRFYPRVRQYYLFLAGRLGSSTTRKHRNGLICTWDYFYNSGGWDDYPPQVYTHKNKIEARTVPTISTSHLIRCARLLRMAAQELRALADIAIYDADIQQLSSALQRDAWDAESGYFGYVTYDDAGDANGILRTDGGVNFNMGLDGVSPLIAGVCSPAQQRFLLDRLFSNEHLWTDVGVTTVDKQAPYYNPDGYWNGSIWFAHQWFLFKTMLDLGRGDLAVKIAQTGVETWQKSTQQSYDCVEHFSVNPPYGAGWCQFSSLSSPALSWFAALWTPGRVTLGFNGWLRESHFHSQRNALSLRLAPQMQEAYPVDALVCLRPGCRYEVHADGDPIPINSLLPGLLRITLPPATQHLQCRGE